MLESSKPGRRLPSIRELALTAVTVALAAIALVTAWSAPRGSELWFWTVACFAGELLWVRLPLGRATLSMASAGNFAALLLLPRGQAMVAAAGASFVSEAVVMRKPLVRLLFNAGQTVLSVGAASLAFHQLAPAGPPAHAILGNGMLPLAAAGAAYALVNTGLVSVAVGLTEHVAPWRAWWTNFGSIYELLSSSALFSLGGLFAVIFSIAGPAGTLFLVLPLLLAHDSYRRYLAREDAAKETVRQAA
jgi:hypothetical protein